MYAVSSLLKAACAEVDAGERILGHLERLFLLDLGVAGILEERLYLRHSPFCIGGDSA